MSDSNPLNNPVLIKGASAFGYAMLADKFILGNTNLQSSAMFAGATSAGIIAGEIISNKVVTSGILPDSNGLHEGKMVSQRLLELTIGVGASYGINMFVLKNDYNINDFLKRIGIITVVDIAAEYTTDYFLNKSVGYLVQ